MSMVSVLTVLVLVGLLAFANGANDNGKGVATLVGFGAAKPTHALLWAAVTTAIGAGVSFWFSGGLIKSFSTGLFSSGSAIDGQFFIAVLAGAFGWVIFATFTGLPVSTTHSITGALIGAGLVAFSASEIRWSELASKFALPLAVSPLVSLAIVYVASWPVVFAVRRIADRCICVVERVSPDTASAELAMSASATMDVAVVADSVQNCEAESPVATVSGTAAAQVVHWASSGFVGFARGWNDAPKIAALSAVALAAAEVPRGSAGAFLVTSTAMALGGFLAGYRVLLTLSKKVTPLPLAESLTASVTTASLVSAASWYGLPVSTTHVSTGAIVGAGLKNDPRAVRWGKVAEILLSWLVTLPVAGLLAAAARLALR